MKISNLFKIRNKKTTCVKELYIGNNRFVIIELLSNRNNIIYDKVVKFLLTSNLDVLWFNDYLQMEETLDLIDIKNNQFIIIG